MDPKDKNLSGSSVETYYEEGVDQNIWVEKFLNDTFQGRSVEEINEAMDMIKEETADIEMGTTTKSALDRCAKFLGERGIATEDESKAIDICTLRVLKMMPAIFDLLVENEDIMEYYSNKLSKLIQRYILPEEEEFLREKVMGSNGMNSLDQHMRINGAAMNIQRHVSSEEMGVVLAHVRFLVKGYMNVQDF